jgi:hypothetical protein
MYTESSCLNEVCELSLLFSDELDNELYDALLLTEERVRFGIFMKFVLIENLCQKHFL